MMKERVQFFVFYFCSQLERNLESKMRNAAGFWNSMLSRMTRSFEDSDVYKGQEFWLSIKGGDSNDWTKNKHLIALREDIYYHVCMEISWLIKD